MKKQKGVLILWNTVYIVFTPYACLTLAPNLKTKTHRETKIGMNVFSAGVTGAPVFS